MSDAQTPGLDAETVVITGGLGFLGRHLIERLQAEQTAHEIYCLDIDADIRSLPEPLREDVTVMERDVCALEADDPELPSPDAIYHLASRASPVYFEEAPEAIADVNTIGTRRVLDYALRHDATVLYPSTSEVYGDPEVSPQPESYTGNVEIRGPRSCYDESKRFGETLVSIYREKYGVDARSVRIFNAYGGHMPPDDGRVIPNFISQTLANEPLTIYGDGEQTRSFCHAEDVIDGIQTVMTATEPSYPVYNVGRPVEVTIAKLATFVQDVIGVSPGITYEPLPGDDPTQRCPDVSRIHSEFGWMSETNLWNGLQRTVETFVQSNPDITREIAAD